MKAPLLRLLVILTILAITFLAASIQKFTLRLGERQRKLA